MVGLGRPREISLQLDTALDALAEGFCDDVWGFRIGRPDLDLKKGTTWLTRARVIRCGLRLKPIEDYWVSGGDHSPW